jgi:hypothetical protein
LTWLKNYAQSGGSYVIELNTNESVGGTCGGFLSYCSYLEYKNKENISITLKGVGAERIISLGEPGAIFNIGSGVTLVLEENITLKGTSTAAAMDYAKARSLVSVRSGGKLIMNEGSAITDGIDFGCSGGGVDVSGDGTFIMNGGLIARNKSFPVPDLALASASGGKIQSYTKKECKGGGVYVTGGGSILGKKLSSGTFTKTGGTITGYASDPENGNVIKDFGGNNILSGFGHAIYFSNAEGNLKSIDTTVGPEMGLSFSDGKISEIPVSAPMSATPAPEPATPAPVPVDEPANSDSEHGASVKD